MQPKRPEPESTASKQKFIDILKNNIASDLEKLSRKLKTTELEQKKAMTTFDQENCSVSSNHSINPLTSYYFTIGEQMQYLSARPLETDKCACV